MVELNRKIDNLEARAEEKEDMDDASMQELAEHLERMDMEARKKRELIEETRAKLKELAELEEEQEFLQLKVNKKIKELEVSIIGMMKGRVEEDVW